MSEDNWKFACSKDRNLHLKPHPNLKKDCLAVVTPLGATRWVSGFRFLKVGETKIGVIVDYYGETRRMCSYVSFWDGREGLFLDGQVRDKSYYIPWMECFALGLKIKGRKNLEYICVAAEKRNGWVTEAIRCFNAAEAGAKVEFCKDYGFFILSDEGDMLTIDEIKISSGNIEIISNNPSSHTFRTALSQMAKTMYKIPNSVRRRYEQKEVLEA